MNQNKVSKIVQSYYIFSIFVCRSVCVCALEYFFHHYFQFNIVCCVHVNTWKKVPKWIERERETIT